MTTTTVAVIPARIRAALNQVLDYAMPDEARDFAATPKAQRKAHIYTALEAVQQWLQASEREADTLAIKQALEAQGYLLAIWHIDDVKGIRPDLSEEQCREVLEQASHKHDAEIGISWDVLTVWADELFPRPRRG